jgi:hypothetical protein
LLVGVSLDQHLSAAIEALTACRAQHPATVQIIGGRGAARHATRLQGLGVDCVTPPLAGLVNRVEQLVASRRFSVPLTPVEPFPPCLPSQAA